MGGAEKGMESYRSARGLRRQILVGPPSLCVSTAFAVRFHCLFAAETLLLMYIFTAFVVETPPLPCFSTAFRG